MSARCLPMCSSLYIKNVPRRTLDWGAHEFHSGEQETTVEQNSVAGDVATGRTYQIQHSRCDILGLSPAKRASTLHIGTGPTQFAAFHARLRIRMKAHLTLDGAG